MILNDAAVCTAMKAALKNGGYTAFGMVLEDELWIGVKGSGWMALAEAGNMPRKILGLIVEHAGGIPMPGQAWRLEKPRKSDIQRQDVMAGVAEEEVQDLLGRQWADGAVARMPLTMDGCGLWQDKTDLSIRKLRPAMEELALWFGKAAYSGGWLAKAGLMSWCFVLKEPDDESHAVWMKHLSQMSWIG